MKTGSGSIKRNSVKAPAFIYFLLFTFIFIQSGCGENPGLIQFQGATMGTWYSVKYRHNAKNLPAQQDIQFAADSVLKVVNSQMSTYIADSEISLFNQYKDTSWFSVSEDFASVVSTGLKIAEETEGAFDITIGPLVNVWGFGPGNKSASVPDEATLAKTRTFVGYNKLSVRLDPPALKKRVPDLYCDLSAIAKGFGVDKVAEMLEDNGIQNYMVEIGGEVRTSGLNKQQPWKIGIATPDEKMGIQAVLNLSDVCVATSGDYHNYFEKDGIRYSHTIDPKTARPIVHNLASVSVVFPNCTGADAYATALNVMGPTKGLEFARNTKLPAFLIVKNDNGFEELMTDNFTMYLQKTKKEN